MRMRIGFICLLLACFVGLSCPLLATGMDQAQSENQPAESVAAYDHEPPKDALAAPAPPAEKMKKQPAAQKPHQTAGKQKEAAKIPDRQENGGNVLDVEQDIMERALELLNTSHEYWVKGDIESALDVLDQAYAMLLVTDGDIDISRQKDDLRLLISKKILAIYTSRQTVTNGRRSEIPIVINAEVEREIRSFQTIERDFFIQSYQRSSFFRPVILSKLKREGLPEELSWLPLVESGFKIRALSRARALGLWQFIPSTGYKYGLNRDEWIDERMDVEKSTRAAIDYMKDLHDMFGDWLTVLAAYNCGEGRVLRVISRQHINYLDNFWDMYSQLPNETARYVPRFLATLEIIKNPEKYGMDLDAPAAEGQNNFVYETVTTNKCMDLPDIAARIGVSEDLLCTMNAELRHKKTPDREYSLKVPPEASVKIIGMMDEILQADKPRDTDRRNVGLIKHRVKTGDTLASLAKKYNTTMSNIRKYNKSVGKNNIIRVGQRLSIPAYGVQSVKAGRVRTVPNENRGADGNIRYKVKKGDTLFSLAKRFDATVPEIKKMNNIKGDVLKVGQVLIINNKAHAEREAMGKKGKHGG